MKIMKTPKDMDLAITNRCNLRCSYCSHFSGPGDVDHDLPQDEWLKFFEELNRCAVLKVTLQGGEPFIRKDIKTLIRSIVKNRMRFGILTNGTLITEDMADFLASTGRCNYVQVSIDGSTSDIHDSCRGDGNFFKAVEGLKNLRDHKVNVTVRVTIHRHNVNDLEEIARLLLEEIGIPGFSTNAASHLGLCRQHADDIQLTVDEHSLAMKTLLKLNKKYNGRITAEAGPLAHAERWVEMERARREGRKAMPDRGYLKGCGGVFNKMAVRADGVMIPCIQMSHIELGQINKDDLRTVWQDQPELRRLRERQDVPLSQFEFCKGCEYTSYCTGNCPAISYTMLGKDNHPSPDACLRRFLENGGELPDDIR
ncbi:SynChlorMet cassette radical SAM/SPASM protein ScmE [Desulfococcaceae bacterium HSG8]|nr:SynChlorMet cassette radical SAM/SPASM protein ScmE [Desulfococcaceae bacterium HSG8]